jgi:hypothetical protein
VSKEALSEDQIIIDGVEFKFDKDGDLEVDIGSGHGEGWRGYFFSAADVPKLRDWLNHVLPSVTAQRPIATVVVHGNLPPETLIHTPNLLPGTYGLYLYPNGRPDMICEQHPTKEWPHDDCAGPGMPPLEPTT